MSLDDSDSDGGFPVDDSIDSADDAPRAVDDEHTSLARDERTVVADERVDAAEDGTSLSKEGGAVDSEGGSSPAAEDTEATAESGRTTDNDANGASESMVDAMDDVEVSEAEAADADSVVDDAVETDESDDAESTRPTKWSIASTAGIMGRRPFLKGAGGMAASAALIGGFASAGASAVLGKVPVLPDFGGKVRKFDIRAISVEIPFSPTGLYQPNGAMYVLRENKKKVRIAEKAKLGTTPLSRYIEPLVIRANEGDIVEIEFKNELKHRCSIHNTGLPYEVATSDGMAVGYNPDTTVAPDGTTTYRWYADRIGTFLFHDGSTPAVESLTTGNAGNSNGFARGLFGAIVVEPKRAKWTDPRTGKYLPSGARANIHVPGGTDHREFVVFYHDPQGILFRDGTHPKYPNSDTEQHIHGINYRATATGDRFRRDDPNLKDDTEQVTFYSSWVHGEPGGGDTVFDAYVGDPTKFVAVGAQIEENHVHHIHGHRWQEGARPVTGEETADVIDAQTLGPGATYEAYLTSGYGDDSLYPKRNFDVAFGVGAGGPHGAPGDYLFHCHMFPHYGEGMNAIFRVHDKVYDDLVELPNNTADNDRLYTKSHPRPSWQELVGSGIDEPGEGAERPPVPDGDVGRSPNAIEKQWLSLSASGAPYVDPVRKGLVKRTIEYTNVAMFAKIAYNDAGDHDPNGRIFAIESARITDHKTGEVTEFDYSDNIQKIRDGLLNPEPPIIRANVGDCIKMTCRNELPQPVSNHIHFVSYDPVGSDSTEVGRLYDQSVAPGDQYTYRWFADEEGAIFWHDHIVGIMFQMHGTFGTLIVEPMGSKWFDPYSGEPMTVGAQAMIVPPKNPAFRELGVLYHDFAPLKDRDGNLVTEGIQHNVNEGIMAINFRNSPYYHRDDDDAAYVFSSARHGDPETPVLEAYEGEPIYIRLVQTAYEEQHSFSVHGLRVDRRGLSDTGSQAQIIGTSEGFTFKTVASRLPKLSPKANASEPVPSLYGGTAMNNPSGLPVTDYLYGSMIDEDLWNGMWGLIRVWGERVHHLKPLPGANAPGGLITNDELRKMGHPAVFSKLSWRKYGQRAKQCYVGNDVDSCVPSDKDARQNRSIGWVPEKAPSPGRPCRIDTPVRRYDVCALRTNIEYNSHGDHDPDGIVYALKHEVPAIKAGLKNPEPLIIRANHGECIELTLENCLDEREDEHFQVDLITGEPLKVIGNDRGDFYGDRLLQFAHGTTDDGILRRGDRDPTGKYARCITYDDITVDLDEQTASVTVRIAKGCDDIELSLACYLKPSDPKEFDRNAHQHLVDAETMTLGPGTHTFTVHLPDPTHPLPRANADWKESLRISMHAQKLRYDAVCSDGATVGFNYDQTVGPGESITYRWYADDEFGSLVLWDMADTRSHWHHGAFGKLIVEPAGSRYYNSKTGKPLKYGTGNSAIIRSRKKTFREFAVVMSDGMDIINPSGKCVVTLDEGGDAHPPEEGAVEPDPHEGEPDAHAADGHMDHPPCGQAGGNAEDQGFGSFNYRSEPFRWRLEKHPDQHLVYSSHEHGDPNTPVFKAYLGEKVVFRTSQCGTKARGVTFHLANHYWPRYHDAESPPVIGVDDRFIPGRSIDMYIVDGAGGGAKSPGDYLFREMKEFLRAESGMWGIFRVYEGEDDEYADIAPLWDSIE